jgi:NAD-dependent deacetylase
MPVPLQDSILEAAKLISNSRHLVIFTGAGISTPSGIPDFRTQSTGLWQKTDPMEVASASAFHHHPERFYDWLRPLLATSQAAKPNPAHLALTKLGQLKYTPIIITQNIDGLHQKAGSTSVIELHGSMQTFECPACHKRVVNTSHVIEEILNKSIPRCRQCGSIIKPDIVLFEEVLPITAWNQAEAEMKKADVLLIAGTSLEVTPAASLPNLALRHSCKLIIINLTQTYLDDQAAIVIAGDVAQVLPEIVKKVEFLR